MYRSSKKTATFLTISLIWFKPRLHVNSSRCDESYFQFPFECRLYIKKQSSSQLNRLLFTLRFCVFVKGEDGVFIDSSVILK